MRLLLVFLLVPPFLLSCRQGDKEITFTGQSIKAKSRTINLSKQDYEEKINPIVDQIYTDTLSTLDQATARNPKWEIEKIEVGIGVTGTLGVGQWKVGATPGLRFMFRPKQ